MPECKVGNMVVAILYYGYKLNPTRKLDTYLQGYLYACILKIGKLLAIGTVRVLCKTLKACF